MAESVASRAPGRPKDQQKRAAILQAAQRLFTQRRYDRVTMELLAAEAGVAKMTVYGHFTDKEALLEAVVQTTAAMMAAALPASPRSSSALEEELAGFGQVFLGVVLSPMVRSLFHQFEVVARDRALAERVYDAGPGHTRATLAAFLEAAAGNGRLEIQDPLDAASDLMSLWVGDLQQRLALGLLDDMSAIQIEKHVRRCTAVFLRAYRI